MACTTRPAARRTCRIACAMHALQSGRTSALTRQCTRQRHRTRTRAPSAAAPSAMITISVQEESPGSLAHAPDLPRSGAAIASLPGRRAVMVGGYVEAPSPEGSPTPVQRREVLDPWVYHPASGWSAVKAAAGAALPPPRMAHQVVSVGEHVYVLGGWHPAAGGEAQFLDDAWRLDVASGAWTRVELTGEPMPRISRFQAVVLPDKRVLIHHHRCDDHVLVLELSSPDMGTLTKVPVTGDVPASRGLHSLTLVPSRNVLVLFGGAPKEGPMMGDLYELDLKTWAWARVEPTTPAGRAPPHARCSHAAAALADGVHVLVCGGAFYKDQQNGGGGLEVLDDIFLYDSSRKSWAWAAPAPGHAAPRLPTARNAACLAVLGSEGHASTRLLLYGGWLPFQKTYNDTLTITVSS